MKKLQDILILINTMTKAEKRHFVLISNLQKGKKEYMYLYEKLDGGVSVDDTYKAFCKKFGKKNIDTAAQYLHQQLLNDIITNNIDNTPLGQTFHLIMQATTLYERHLIDAAFAMLEKAAEHAQKMEQDVLLLHIRRLEIMYLNQTGYEGLSEKEVVNKNTRLNECLKHTRTTNMHVSLYSTLNYRIHYLNKIRSDKQKEMMNDLVLSELNLMSNHSYSGFESVKLHLLFQATYYLNTGSYKSAIRYYAELLDLFDEYDHLKRNPPIYYFSTIEGILSSLTMAQVYEEIPPFVDKLKELDRDIYPLDFRLKVRRRIFFTLAQQLVNTGRFEEARELCDTYSESLQKKAGLLHLKDQLNLFLHISIIYLCCKEIKSAKEWMKKIYREGKIFQTFPAYRIARLVKLIIDIEAKDYDLIENETRSIKRSLKKDEQPCHTEKLVIKYVLLCPLPKYEKTRMQLWKKIEKDINEIRENKYERYILDIFDFTSWIESRFLNIPFAAVLTKEDDSEK